MTETTLISRKSGTCVVRGQKSYTLKVKRASSQLAYTITPWSVVRGPKGYRPFTNPLNHKGHKDQITKDTKIGIISLEIFTIIVSLKGNPPIFVLISTRMEKNQKYRRIAFYKNYFQVFFDKQSKKVKDKIVWTFELIEDLQRVPETYLKHIDHTDGLFEIRVQQGSDIFRIFCFFDQGQLVVLANGFQKKTQKTPKKEIQKALKIKAEYEGES